MSNDKKHTAPPTITPDCLNELLWLFEQARTLKHCQDEHYHERLNKMRETVTALLTKPKDESEVVK